MKLFISYSFKDAPTFEDVSQLMTNKAIPFFSTSEMLAGTSLADQLRDTIAGCAVCLFIATHNSVKSAWCSAELGAFWGAGKQVVIYVADGSLKETQLPKQFNGHLLERNMHRAVEAARIRLASSGKAERQTAAVVGDLSIAELRALIIESAQTASARNRMADLLFGAAGLFDFDSRATFEDRSRWAYRRLQDFIGQNLPPSLRWQPNGWRYTFTALTTTGAWHGYALHQESQADGMLDLYRQCLLFRLDTADTVVSAALVDVVTLAHKALGLSSWTTSRDENIFAVVGQDELGDAVPEST
jgi:hypothetical protein